MEKGNDRKLIRLMQKKPSDGLAEAIRQYGGLVRLVISRILPNNPEDVEECVADTFVSAWKNIGEFSDDGNLKGFILCIARNTAINRYRQLRRLNHVSSDLPDFPEIADDDDLELSFIADEEAKNLHTLIIAMKEPDREMIIRKYFLFESLKEIGERFGLTDEQVKKKLYNSRQRLKKQLEENTENFDMKHERSEGYERKQRFFRTAQ